MVIARVLTPAEIGVFSVTMVLLTFVATVRDMGAGSYLVQERELTTERIRAVWAIQLGLGLGLACIVALASYPIAIFYKEPRMRDIMLVVALNYAVNPFGSLTYAWLMREMRFESVALMRFTAALSGALVSTWLAWKNYGPISLAFGSLMSTIANAIMAIYFRPKYFPWLPGISEIRRVLAFGSKLTGITFVNIISNGAPELLLGKLQDVTAVGLFSRSSGLVQMFYRLVTDAVAAVCMPWFARQSREEGNVVSPFLRATSYVTAFGWSFCFIIICLAHPIIRILYGNQWNQAVDLARLLAVATAFSVPASLCSVALLSSGAIEVVAKLTIINAITTITLIIIGASQGVFTLSICIIFAAAISATLSLRLTAKHIGLSIITLVKTLQLSMIVALISSIGPFFVLWFYGPYPIILFTPLIFGLLSSLAGFLISILLFSHPLQDEFLTLLSKIKTNRA